MEFSVEKKILGPSTTGIPMKHFDTDIATAIAIGLTLAALALEWFDVLTY